MSTPRGRLYRPTVGRKLDASGRVRSTRPSPIKRSDSKKDDAESPPITVTAPSSTPPTRGSVTARRRRISSDLALRKAMQKRAKVRERRSSSNSGEEGTTVEPPATVPEEGSHPDEPPTKTAASQEMHDEKNLTDSAEVHDSAEETSAFPAAFSSPLQQHDDSANVAAVSPVAQGSGSDNPEPNQTESATPRKAVSTPQHQREEARSSPVELPEERNEVVLLRRERDHLKRINERLTASGRQQAKRIHELHMEIKVLQSKLSDMEGTSGTVTLSSVAEGAAGSSHEANPNTSSETSQLVHELRERDAEQRQLIESLQTQLAEKTEAAAAAMRDKEHLSATMVTLEWQADRDRKAWEAELESTLSRTKQHLDELRGTVRSTAEQVLAVHKEKWDRERADLESKSRDLQFQLHRHLRQEQGGSQALLRRAEETAAAHSRLEANVRRACELLTEARQEGEKYRRVLAQQSSGLLSLEDIVRGGVEEDSSWSAAEAYPPRLAHEGSLFEDSMTELVSVWRQRVRQTQQMLAQKSAGLKHLHSLRRDAVAFLQRYVLRLQTVQDLLETSTLLSDGHAVSEELVGPLNGSGER